VRALQILLTLFGALALLSLGAVSASASAGTPPCHQTAEMADHGPSKAPQPTKPLKVMGCCVACVATPLFEPLPQTRPVIGPAAVPAGSLPSLAGRALAPELDPPKA